MKTSRVSFLCFGVIVSLLLFVSILRFHCWASLAGEFYLAGTTPIIEIQGCLSYVSGFGSSKGVRPQKAQSTCFRGTFKCIEAKKVSVSLRVVLDCLAVTKQDLGKFRTSRSHDYGSWYKLPRLFLCKPPPPLLLPGVLPSFIPMMSHKYRANLHQF